MGALNFNEKAELLDKGGELIQQLYHCKGISTHNRNMRFTGSGQIAGSWTKELAVKDKIPEYLLEEGKTKVRYNGRVYLLAGSEEYDDWIVGNRRSRVWRLYLQ